jgi:hypothetical protein
LAANSIRWLWQTGSVQPAEDGKTVKARLQVSIVPVATFIHLVGLCACFAVRNILVACMSAL